MEIAVSSPSFLVALALTFVLCIASLFALRASLNSAAKRRFRHSCDESISDPSMTTCESYLNGDATAVRDRNGAASVTGASMMEQLVPEITTHALSYLDYPSLCRLSMTNSAMRKAANDDNAWKALYHKDFTLEQDSIMPKNGWKAYYAATRAIVNVNAEFFDIIRERSLPAMSRLWLNADYVKCIHAPGDIFSGYNAVIQSWQLAFNWQAVDFQVRDVRARVLTETAWVTMKTYVDIDPGTFQVTNVFELHNGRWYLVHHHGSFIMDAGEADQQVGHG
uniref:F-box domain-containing protein n=1 Tax=Kalanchoe fedtschenkoi TaxID=63787 RepID=A0A7N0UW57_KALFE